MKSLISEEHQMAIPSVENIGISTMRLAASMKSGISDRCDMDTVVRTWMAGLMSDQPHKDGKLTSFRDVIGHVHAVRAGLGEITEEMRPTDSALAYINELKAGLDTTAITLRYLMTNLGGDATQVELAFRSAPSKPEFHECPKCGGLIGPHAPHYCEPTERDEPQNKWFPDEIDALLGVDGWVEIPASEEDKQEAERARREELNRRSPAPIEAAAEPENAEVYEDEPRPLGMREGSKKHRVWVATERLLVDNGQMHIDEMLKTVGSSELFSGVSQPRARFANLLSQYKALRLVESDNLGNYWLPNGKAVG